MKRNDKCKPLVVIQCYEDRQPTLPLRKAEPAPPAPTTNGHRQLKRDTTDNAPPPPPMPNSNSLNGLQNGDHKNGEEQKPIPKLINADLIKNSNNIIRKNGTFMRTPTPDYNTKSEAPAPPKVKSVNGEKAELDSLESFKLKNPSNVQPKPPSNYFVRAPNGTATMKKHGRPVSVTIGEYSTSGARREPSKLEFLNGDKTDGPHVPEESISNRLQSELALTLSRSNLRKKTEAMDLTKLRKGSSIQDDSDSSVDKNFHARYGNNLLPLPPSVMIPKVSKLKH